MLTGAALSMVILVLIVSVGVLILAGFNDSTSNADASTVIEAGIDSMGDFSDWFAVIVVVLVSVAVISLVLWGFSKRGGLS